MQIPADSGAGPSAREKNVSVSSGTGNTACSAQPIYVGGRLSHWEGVLRPKGGVAPMLNTVVSALADTLRQAGIEAVCHTTPPP